MQEIAVRAWEPIFEGFRDRMGEELFALCWPDGWEDGKAQQIALQFQHHSEWCLVAEIDGRIVGFITFRLDPQTRIAEIGNNAVDPDCQGQGLGAAQYRHVLPLFREAGMVYAKVHTGLDEAHAPARAAYQKVGFELTNPTGDYYCKL